MNSRVLEQGVTMIPIRLIEVEDLPTMDGSIP